MSFPWRLSCLAVSVCLFSSVVAAQPGRIAGRIDSTHSVVLTGHVHAGANARNDRGALEDGFQLPGVTLLLKPTAAQQADLEQLLQQQQDPASPNYHRWLTPEQYAERFGVAASDVAQIVSWLESQGLTVNNVARSRTFVSFSGTAAQAASALHTSFHRYSVNGEIHFANATDPAIPAALAGVVAGFQGLTDFHLKPRLRRPLAPEMTTGGAHHIAPDDFATIFDIAKLYTAGVDGTGQTIAIVGQSLINTSDIQKFRSNFNLGAPNLQTKPVPYRPNPGIVPGDVDESNLDIEWAGAVARNASVIFVYSDDVWQSATYAVVNNLAPILSMSYGTCEPSDLVDLPASRRLVQQANAQGITWFAATGDSGSADCEDQGAAIAENGLAIDIPAGIPEVTAMGGTEFNDVGGAYWSATNTPLTQASALKYIPEMAWNDTNLGFGLSATGGGASTYFARPAWQTGPGVPNDSARHIPDLAFPASADHDGYYFYSSGSPGYVGGTSAATPTMAGVFALLNQYLISTSAQKQAGLGNINPALYRLAQSNSGSAIFHDITFGDNIVPCAAGSPNCQNGSVGLSTGPGYDQVTGLGSVDAYNLLHQWSSQPVLTSSVVPSIDQNPVFQQPPDASGNPWRFKITLTEEAGIGTTLTDFTIDGVSYASQIASLFGGAAIAPNGSISASYGLKNVAIPKNVVFGFAGVDASGVKWTTQLSIPFQGPQVQLAIGGIANAATGQQMFAPGMILSVYGAAMGNFAQSAGAIPLPNYLAGFEAYVNGVSAPLYYVSPNQVNLQIPYETQAGPATLEIGNPYVNITYNFTVSAAGPGIFTFLDGSVNPSRAASRGQEIAIYITGEGQVRPSLATGSTPSSNTPLTSLPKPRQTVTVTVGGQPATIDFIGIPSGLVGVTQINFSIPNSVALGPQPVVVTVGTTPSPAATIAIQ